MSEKLARTISIVLHPLLITTLGFILLLTPGFFFGAVNWEVKKYIVLVVFFTTCILPLISIGILALNPRFDFSFSGRKDRMLTLLSTGSFYYVGYILLNRIQAYPAFKFFLLASVLLIVILLILSYRWRISTQMAALGALTGCVFGLSFKTGSNPVYLVLLVILLSGLAGSASLQLKNESFLSIAGTYGLGFSVLYLLVYFV